MKASRERSARFRIDRSSDMESSGKYDGNVAKLFPVRENVWKWKELAHERKRKGKNKEEKDREKRCDLRTILEPRRKKRKRRNLWDRWIPIFLARRVESSRVINTVISPMVYQFVRYRYRL